MSHNNDRVRQAVEDQRRWLNRSHIGSVHPERYLDEAYTPVAPQVLPQRWMPYEGTHPSVLSGPASRPVLTPASPASSYSSHPSHPSHPPYHDRAVFNPSSPHTSRARTPHTHSDAPVLYSHVPSTVHSVHTAGLAPYDTTNEYPEDVHIEDVQPMDVVDVQPGLSVVDVPPFEPVEQKGLYVGKEVTVPREDIVLSHCEWVDACMWVFEKPNIAHLCEEVAVVKSFPQRHVVTVQYPHLMVTCDLPRTLFSDDVHKMPSRRRGHYGKAPQSMRATDAAYAKAQAEGPPAPPTRVRSGSPYRGTPSLHNVPLGGAGPAPVLPSPSHASPYREVRAIASPRNPGDTFRPRHVETWDGIDVIPLIDRTKNPHPQGATYQPKK